MRILVAEDESSIARALKALLEKNKYTVDVVDNGTDALAYITSSPYDALVLDIMMPGMDGIQVLRAARTQGVATPALFLTAKSQVEDRVAGLDAGGVSGPCAGPDPAQQHLCAVGADGGQRVPGLQPVRPVHPGGLHLAEQQGIPADGAFHAPSPAGFFIGPFDGAHLAGGFRRGD